MGAVKPKVLQVITGWDAVELILHIILLGLWQFLKIAVKRLWKGHRRKPANSQSVELTVDSAIGTHCYIKIMGVKYHYVEIGPKYGQTILVLGDAPDNAKLWCSSWTKVVRRLADSGYHVVTLDLRGTGSSEGGNKSELSPPRAVEEITALMKEFGISESRPAIVMGFGVGGMLSWYLAHSQESLISKLAVIGAPHPNHYWKYPPAAFCETALHFIQWPYLPERWLADEAQEGERRWTSSRACDWSGALNYVRGAAWWRINPHHRISCPTLLVSGKERASELISSAEACSTPTLRMITDPGPKDVELPAIVLDFLLVKEKPAISSKTEEPRGLVGRMLGAVAGRGRELTARLVLPPA